MAGHARNTADVLPPQKMGKSAQTNPNQSTWIPARQKDDGWHKVWKPFRFATCVVRLGGVRIFVTSAEKVPKIYNRARSANFGPHVLQFPS